MNDDPYESVKSKSNTVTEGPVGKSSEDVQSKEEIYELLGKFADIKSSPRETSSKSEKIVERERTESKPVENCDLYAKVKKISSVSNGPNPNLNSDFVSIYELTKVDSNSKEKSKTDLELTTKTKGEHKKSDSWFHSGNHLNEASSEPKSKSNFALDFSAKRKNDNFSDKNAQYNVFEPQDDELELHENIYGQEEGDISENGDFNDKPNKVVQRNTQSSVENDPIPKMNINMFIQKDAKSNVRSWPKVETRPTHQKPKHLSPTKQLIGKFNNGLNQPVEARTIPSKMKSPTKLLINKFNNPNELNKRLAPGGFHGIKSILNEMNPSQNTHTPQPNMQNAFKSHSRNIQPKSVHSSPGLYRASPIQVPNRKSPVPLPRYSHMHNVNMNTADI